MEPTHVDDDGRLFHLKEEAAEQDTAAILLDLMCDTTALKCEGCLGNENLQSIANTDVEPAYPNCFSMFKECFNIEVGKKAMYEGVPSYICCNCFEILKQSYSFRRKVMESQQLLNKNISKIGNESEDSNDALAIFVSPNTYDYQSAKDEADEIKESKVKKPRKKRIKREIKSEPKIKDENKKEAYSDSEEKKQSIYQRELNRLKLNYYGLKKGSTKCNKCVARFKTHARLLSHMKKHFTEHVCFNCHLKFKSSNAVNEHLKNVCMREFRYGCPNCDEGFMSDLSRKKHMKQVHNLDVEVFTCNQCGREFLNYHQMVTHIEGVHEKVRDRECPICGKFYYNKRIHKHLKSHNTIKSCTCDICGKSFNTSDTLKRHKKVHLPKEHCCPICGMEFTYKNSFKLHMSRYHPDAAIDEKSCNSMLELVQMSEEIVTS